MKEVAKVRNFPDPAARDKLIAAHDGDTALLWLWLCRSGVYNGDRAAEELCRTLGEMDRAYEKLCRMGLYPITPDRKEALSSPAEELPQYTVNDVLRRSSEDGSFKAVLQEAERVLGRSLSSPDMKILFGIYDYLALPTEVIFVLLNYCTELYRQKYGPGRLPSMRSIEKEAYSWANNEILTLEQAEEFIEESRSRRSRAEEIKAALGIRGRELTPTERKYVFSWLDMGFSVDALSVAYDRTVTNTGSLKWNYMNKIVSSWHQKGIHTVQEIEEKDRRTPTPAKNTEPNAPASQAELARLRSIYEKVKNT